MKQILVAFGLMISAFAAQAATQTNPSPTPQPTPVSAAASSGVVVVSSPTPTPQPVVSSSDQLHFAIGIYGSSKGSMYFNDTEFVSGSSLTDGTLQYDASSALGLQAEAIYARRNGPGFSAGVDIETPRKLSNPSVNTNGITYSPTAFDNTTIQFISLYGNFIYRFDAFFLFLGMNLARPNIQNPPPLLGSAVATFGGQVGLGWFFSDHFAVDLGSHFKGIYSDTISDAGTTVRPRTGTVSAVNLTAKYIF